ncbi:DUF4350 domain-containing protein [Sphaerisporangium aureirubrum]|uniref:DUF4350 domain-containing protein n=1 Tax=Sphaerisporangium aureirubrum TaxID=1544736 RepID=A0ABW1NV71_9ACTN
MTIAPPREAATSASTSPTARSLWRGGRGVAVVGALILLVAVVTVLFTGTSTEGRPLDPADTTLTGSKALAEILRRQGVRVERVTSVEEAVRLDGADRLLLLSPVPQLFAPDAPEKLAATKADRLLVGQVPGMPLLGGGIVVKDSTTVGSRAPRCDLPAAAMAGSVYIGGVTYTTRQTPPRAFTCYPDRQGPSLARVSGERTVTAVGDGAFMTNQRLAEDGNAALAVNLTGARPVLIWLVPPDETPGGAGSGSASLTDLLPRGIPWAVLQLLVAVLLVALWRMRRLGPVVVERLPVVVRAAETVEGRGRLYRARRARDQAAFALRAATAARLTPRLGLTADATQEQIAAIAAMRTGRDPSWVRAVMFGPPPSDDAGLVSLAGHLDTLERQVREP